ncbi:MAG: UDP-galactopyranose mutase [Bacteroidaceae bacterium]|nr:UDP-galactopyranose mutase [Bacteroidaceae bacterium]
MKTKYDFLIVGTGLFGAVSAYLLKQKEYSVLMIDKRAHIGGNVYTEKVNGINVHKYGAHIFHTSNKEVWQFVNSFVEFNRYTNSPVANYKGKLYNLPFNMNTFYQMWGVKTPAEAQLKIEEQRKEASEKLRAKSEQLGIPCEPQNLEEQALLLVGRDIYEALIKGYTQKQWGRQCTELPAFIIKRLPVRFTFDNNYFNDTYQGIPIGGYTHLIEKMIAGCEVRLGIDYFQQKDELDAMADRVIYTGEIDRYFNYQHGHLQYRTVSFETEVLEDVTNYQGNAVVNYTDAETPYTRIIEHKHFEMIGADVVSCPDTIISREYSKEWQPGDEPYYPVNDDKNSALYAQYEAMADAQNKVIFGGRLAEYKYYDMHKVIERAFEVIGQL